MDYLVYWYWYGFIITLITTYSVYVDIDNSHLETFIACAVASIAWPVIVPSIILRYFMRKGVNHV